MSLFKAKKQKLAFLLTLLCFTPSTQSHAQTQLQLPGSVDPGKINERLRLDPQENAPEIIPPKTQNIDDTIPEAENGLILNGIKLEGIKVFSEEDFAPLINEYTGRSVDLRTLQHLTARIKARYRENGYFISNAVIPAQEINSEGIVIIRVIEGYVHEVKINDPENILDRDHLNIIEKTAQNIQAMNPLHGPTMEKDLLLLNDTHGIIVQSILNAPDSTKTLEAGAVDVILKIESTSSKASLTYNNHGSRFVGPHQFEATWRTGNIITAMDSLQLQLSTSIPFREVQFGSGRYSIPLNENGLSAYTELSYSNSEPGHTLRILEVESDATTIKAGLRYPWIRSRAMNLNFDTSLNIQNSATEFLNQELIDDKIRYFLAKASFQTTDSKGGSHALDLNIKKGIDILSATKTGTQNLSRAQGRSDFFSVGLEGNMTSKLFQNWSLSNSLAAQYAPHPLLSSQEFGYGGEVYGRAYDASEITGDSGLKASIELRYSGIEPVNLSSSQLYLTPFTFYDIGKVWNQETSIKPQSSASAGLGLHFALNDNYYGSLQAAWPLTLKPTTPIMNNQNSPRILFSLTRTF